jgi:hypothetical protein
MINNPTTHNSKIDQTILAEIELIPKAQAGQRVTTVAQVADMEPETRLVLLLDACSGTIYLASSEVFHHLKAEFYTDFDARKGGLTFRAYVKYAGRGRLVAEAAQRHRDYVARGRNSASQHGEQEAGQ